MYGGGRSISNLVGYSIREGDRTALLSAAGFAGLLGCTQSVVNGGGAKRDEGLNVARLGAGGGIGPGRLFPSVSPGAANVSRLGARGGGGRVRLVAMVEI